MLKGMEEGKITRTFEHRNVEMRDGLLTFDLQRASLIDSHAAGKRAGFAYGCVKFSAAVLLVARTSLARHMRFQALVEVVDADTGVDDSNDDQDNCDHCKESQGLPCGDIWCLFRRRIHPRELEDEISQAAEKEEL